MEGELEGVLLPASPRRYASDCKCPLKHGNVTLFTYAY